MPAQRSRPAVSTDLAAIADYFFPAQEGERTIAFLEAPALTGATATLDFGGVMGQIAVSPADVVTSLELQETMLKVRIARSSGVFAGSWRDEAGLPHTFSGIVFGAQGRALGVDVSAAGNAPVIFTPR